MCFVRCTQLHNGQYTVSNSLSRFRWGKGKKNLVDTKAIKVKFILTVNKINIKDFNVPGYI